MKKIYKTFLLPINRRNFLKKSAAVGLAASAFPYPSFAKNEDIHIGAILPFSGGLDLFAAQAKLGLDQAMQEINDRGGIKKINILYQDNQGDPRRTVDIARKLIGSKKITALVGPITSNARNALKSTIIRTKTPLLYATNYEGGTCDHYFFSFNTTPNQELEKLLPHMQQQRAGSYYLFGANYIWPKTMFEKAETIIADLNSEIVGKEFTPWGVTDFTPILRKIEQSGADKLLFALPGADGITFIKQAEAFGLMKNMIVGFLGFSEAYLSAFAPGQAENMQVALPFVAESQNPASRDFIKRLQKSFGNDVVVSHYVMTHYNALQALSIAIERADSIESNRFIPQMEGLKFDTPAGQAFINAENHHVSMNMFLAATRQGKLEPLKELGLIAPEADCV